jgi:hypothetical protein
MQKKQVKSKLTPEQKEKHKKALAELNAEFEAAEGNEAVDLKTAKDMPEMVWACTPEIKLKAGKAQFDLQLSPEQARGGVIRIIRTGSNKIKICSMIETKYLDDGVAEAKKQAKDQADKDLQAAVKDIKKKKAE